MTFYHVKINVTYSQYVEILVQPELPGPMGTVLSADNTPRMTLKKRGYAGHRDFAGVSHRPG